VIKINSVMYSAAALLAGLSAIAWMTIASGPHVAEEVNGAAIASKSPQSETAPAPHAVDSAYAVIDEHPLFLSTRQPPPETLDHAGFSAASSAPFALVGTVITGGRKLAVLKRTSDKDATPLAIGGTIDGWTLLDVGKSEAYLENGDRREVLRLADEKDRGHK
jgi:hypothetical protein